MGVKGILKRKISPYPLKSFAIKPSNQSPILISTSGSQLVVGWVSAFLVETLLVIGRIGFRKI
ncbi:hypothetical protein HMPREF1392_00414 [Helicobacter pylori GAM101Biv]|nr:hypothetical protein HMPREF1392_00414 [Helicobacter pylori GAM101Biv]